MNAEYDDEENCGDGNCPICLPRYTTPPIFIVFVVVLVIGAGWACMKIHERTAEQQAIFQFFRTAR